MTLDFQHHQSMIHSIRETKGYMMAGKEEAYF